MHIFKSLECDICKQDIQGIICSSNKLDIIRVHDEVINLIELKTPDTNYLMLESVNRHKHESRFIYILDMNEKRQVSFGRANTSDIKMTDISVSRHHSNILLSGGEFYLEDLGSKFGTKTLLQTDIYILPTRALSIHSGKYWLNFYMDITFCGSCCCYK